MSGKTYAFLPNTETASAEEIFDVYNDFFIPEQVIAFAYEMQIKDRSKGQELLKIAKRHYRKNKIRLNKWLIENS